MEVEIDILLVETFQILEDVVRGSESGECMNDIIASLEVDVSCLLVSFGNDGVGFDLCDMMSWFFFSG
jgi:hypothetical protein